MTILARALCCRSAAVAFAARVLLPVAILLAGPIATLEAQMPEPGSPIEGWGMMAPQAQPPQNEQPQPPATEAPATGNVTEVPRTAAPDSPKGGAGGGAVPVEFVAFLTDDGQRIEQGLVWRLYENGASGDRRGKLMKTERSASPVLSLTSGSYIVNAAFGRAHLTRKITVPAAAGAARQVEKFVLNAGGLRINALLGGKPAPPGSITYAIHTDRDQTDDRRLILGGAKPGLVIRLNAGIYHIVSTYGDANAIVRSDVTVEAGKLTEASIVHTFAKVSFKLVERAGGEALPDTQWTIQTPEGGIVKESVGALPSHTLAPGSYTVVARNQAKAFRRDFTVQDGQHEAIEIVLQ